MKLSSLKAIRTVDCPRDALPGTVGFVNRRTAAREMYAERAYLIAQRGNEPEDRAIVQTDSGRVVNIRRRAFRVQLLTHPAWN